MIKYLFSFFFFSTQFLFSQTYHFDYYVEDSSRTFGSSKDPWIRNFFYDSHGQNKLILRNDGKGLYATIYDEKGNRSHYFDVNSKDNRLTFAYGFTHDYGKGNFSNDVNKNDVFEIKKKDSLNYTINIFSNDKKKKIKYEMDVFLEANDAEFLELPMEYSRYKEVAAKLKENLPHDKKFVIKNANSKNFKRNIKSQSELKKFEKTELTLVVPEKLISKNLFENIANQ